MNGLFITLEGGEGSGKTTIANEVIKKLANHGVEGIHTREPGGSVIAEKIREVILNPLHTEMDARTEALLYAAARRQHLVEKIKPAIAAGKIVLCERFIDSSIVYQGYARGIGTKEVYAINEFAIDGYLPDLTIFLDITPELGLKRIAADQNRELDRLDLEGMEFHKMVYEGYMEQVKSHPERIKVVDATKSIDTVIEEIYQLILRTKK